MGIILGVSKILYFCPLQIHKKATRRVCISYYCKEPKVRRRILILRVADAKRRELSHYKLRMHPRHHQRRGGGGIQNSSPHHHQRGFFLRATTGATAGTAKGVTNKSVTRLKMNPSLSHAHIISLHD